MVTRVAPAINTPAEATPPAPGATVPTAEVGAARATAQDTMAATQQALKDAEAAAAAEYSEAANSVAAQTEVRYM